MEHHGFRYKVTFFFITVILSISSINFAAETIKLSTGEWPPYTSEKDKDGKIAETIVKEAFQQVNIIAQLEYFPWKRAYEAARHGELTGTFPWAKSEKRLKDFIFSNESLITTKEVFFHLKATDLKWEKFEDLKKYKIGGTDSYAHIDLLAQNGITVEVVHSPKLNFKKVFAGRIDTFPESFIVGYNLIFKLFPPHKAALFTNNSKPLRTSQSFLLISKKIPNGKKIIKDFDTGLKKLKQSGRYDEIISENIFK